MVTPEFRSNSESLARVALRVTVLKILLWTSVYFKINCKFHSIINGSYKPNMPLLLYFLPTKKCLKLCFTCKSLKPTSARLFSSKSGVNSCPWDMSLKGGCNCGENGERGACWEELSPSWGSFLSFSCSCLHQKVTSARRSATRSDEFISNVPYVIKQNQIVNYNSQQLKLKANPQGRLERYLGILQFVTDEIGNSKPNC